MLIFPVISPDYLLFQAGGMGDCIGGEGGGVTAERGGVGGVISSGGAEREQILV